MARIFIDGFESGGYEAWDAFSGVSISSSTKFTGAYALNVVGGGSSITKFVSSQNAYYIAFKHFNNTADSRAVVNFLEGATVHIDVERYINGSGTTIVVKRGGTTLAQGSIIKANQTWYLLEVYCLIDDSAGRVIVKVDGIVDIDYTGDTRNGGTSGVIDRINWGYRNGGPQTSCYIDDVVIDDANWIGNSGIAGLSPNGAGNSTQWDPSTGANYACVDEVPPSDTDYVSTNVVDEVDTYALSNLPSEAAVVKCVQVMARARKEGASTPQNLNLAVRTTGGDAYSGDKALTTSFAGHSNLWETNPGTALAWTVAEVNAMEAGIKAKT